MNTLHKNKKMQNNVNPGKNYTANIEWLNSSGSTDFNDLKHSNLASVRLRTFVASQAAQAAGFQNVLSDGENNKKADIVVVGKIDYISDKNRPARWINQIKKQKTNDAKIIIDYTDHHLESDTLASKFYEEVIPLSDIVICSSAKLKEHIFRIFGLEAHVIEDPIEVPISEPSKKNNLVTTILWFGHASNLEYLINCLEDYFSEKNNARLILMTNAFPLPDEYTKRLDIPNLKNIEINVIPWSKDDLIEVSKICDFCIIPTGFRDSRKNGASSNRLLTSLALGLPTLTDNLDSYQSFSKYFSSITKEKICSMIENPEINEDLIIESQKLIEKEFSRENIGYKWVNLFEGKDRSFFEEKESIRNKSNGSEEKQEYKLNKIISGIKLLEESAQIKLNLGCGDKILKNYINVDVAEMRAGNKPDIICDLHDLGIFKDNSVDEILAVHVIEHFWQWEVVDILKEWTRILKPGGKMILECPNLISAAQEFLKNPDISAAGGKEGQRSMWVFYGDPGWKDPLMIHRWGYTPKSLAFIMQKAGLTKLRQEPAQFKLREPRDMRITGEK
jgi:SAM-dependent methyltransferase